MARKANILKNRDIFYIITNGKKTEYNYFNLLKSKHSIYDVKIIFENADPLGLVILAQKYISEANQVWCVFDIDYTYDEKRLLPALQKAERLGVKIAYSNISFEVWLISHFEKCKTTLQLDDYVGELNKLLKKYKYNKTYSKSDENLLKEQFIPKYKTAIVNSKIIYQNYIKAHNEKNPNQKPPIWDWISSTTVYKLVEALKLQK